MRNKLIEIHFHRGALICSFASYNSTDHVSETQREKHTHGVFMSIFSWNGHLKCHLGAEGPLQGCWARQWCWTNIGDAQQVALPWEAESEKLEGTAQLHQTRELISFFTPLHPPFGTHHVPVPWEQLRCIPW